jgi:molybdate/tungstate transport system substrate-binding protein
MKKFLRTVALAAVSCAMLLNSCAPRQKTPLVVFAAGSLITPFQQIKAAFEKSHPDIEILDEYHGSIQVVRHATELHEKIDVVATADQSLIPYLMYRDDPTTGKPYAAWNMGFASNRLALAYTTRSKFASEITNANWTEVISREGIKLGMADPRFDTAGYRTLMLLYLAGRFYQQPTFFTDLVEGAFQ